MNAPRERQWRGRSRRACTFRGPPSYHHVRPRQPAEPRCAAMLLSAASSRPLRPKHATIAESTCTRSSSVSGRTTERLNRSATPERGQAAGHWHHRARDNDLASTTRSRAPLRPAPQADARASARRSTPTSRRAADALKNLTGAICTANTTSATISASVAKACADPTAKAFCDGLVAGVARTRRSPLSAWRSPTVSTAPESGTRRRSAARRSTTASTTIRSSTARPVRTS